MCNVNISCKENPWNSWDIATLTWDTNYANICNSCTLFIVTFTDTLPIRCIEDGKTSGATLAIITIIYIQHKIKNLNALKWVWFRKKVKNSIILSILLHTYSSYSFIVLLIPSNSWFFISKRNGNGLGKPKCSSSFKRFDNNPKSGLDIQEQTPLKYRYIWSTETNNSWLPRLNAGDV